MMGACGEGVSMSYFSNKQAAVTGAGAGIGRALARHLHAAGAELWLSDVDKAGLGETLRALSGPARVHGSHVDVADAAAVNRWRLEISAATSHLDLLVNNAGVGLIGPAQDLTLEDFHWLMDINFWGVIHGCNAFLPLLSGARRGHLVNISSIFGLMGVPSQAAYNAAKFAVRGYTEALRQDLARAGSRVAVCCVHPGGIDTNIAKRARNIDPAVTPQEQQERFSTMVRTSAEDAARQILAAAERGRERLLIGRDARLVDWIVRLFPSCYPRLLRRSFAALEPRSDE